MPLEKDSGSSDQEQSASIALLKTRLSGFETEEGRLKGLHYVPGPRDVGISTTPKAGTTWMQQICHQLRSTNGDMNFSEISEVVPWLELAHDQGQDLTNPQYGHETNELRFFKTHAWAEHCPAFGKTIVVIRDPCDVLVSFYKFFEDWFFEPGTISIDAFAKEFWLARGIPDESKMQNASYFVHLVSWYKVYKAQQQSGDQSKKIMFVCFEDLKSDLIGQIQRVAEFLSDWDDRYAREPARIQAAVTRSTYDFMKEHSGQFDDKLSKLSRNQACGLPKDAGMQSTKIGTGVSGQGKLVLSDELRQQIQQKWNEIVQPVTGCATYQELCQQLAKEQSIM